MNYRHWIIFFIFFFICGSPVSFCSEGIQKKIRISSWGEFYNESTSFRRREYNLISFSHIRQGINIFPGSRIKIQMYLTMRYGKDLHKDYWNNRFETGIGLRVRYSYKVFLALYILSIQGYYIKIPEGYPQPKNDKYNDFRTGIIFWYGWIKSRWSSHLISFPMKWWGEIYSDVSYYRRQRNNVINYTNLRTGIRLFQFWKSAIDSYGEVTLANDINKDYWNNKIEFGPGIWLRPMKGLSLKLFVEWVQGHYFDVKGIYENPYPKSYRDRRFGIIFWIGW